MLKASKEYLERDQKGTSETYDHRIFLNGKRLKDIEIESVIYHGSGCENGAMGIGCTCSSYVEISVRKNTYQLKGLEIEIYELMQMATGEEEWHRKGFFTVKEAEREGDIITYTAYDRMYTCFNDYFDPKPYIDRELREPFLDQNLEYEYNCILEILCWNYDIDFVKTFKFTDPIEGFINDNHVPVTFGQWASRYRDPLSEGNYTEKQVIGFIAANLCANAFINRDGNLEFKRFSDGDIIEIDEESVYMDAETFFDDIDSFEYTGLQVEKTVISKAEDAAESTKIGAFGDTTGNTLKLANPICQEEIVSQHTQTILGLSVSPMTIKCVGHSTVELFDIIRYTYTDEDTGESKTVQFPVLQITSECDGGMTSEFTMTIEEDAGESGGVYATMATTALRQRIGATNELTLGKLNAVEAYLNFATIESLNVLKGQFEELTGKTITTETLEAALATIDIITAGTLAAEIAKLGYLNADTADLRYANIDFSNIDTANINQATIKGLLEAGGIIARTITGATGTFADWLTGVNIYANNITGGTLSVDRLVFRGQEKSIVYELNNITGALQAQNLDTLNGEILTPRTIAADKIIANSITATELATSFLTVVRGENILRSTNDMKELSSSGTWDAGKWRTTSVTASDKYARKIIDISDPPVPGISKGLRIETAVNDIDPQITQNNISLNVGQIYTMSCYGRCTVGTPRLVLRVTQAGGRPTVIKTLTTEWKRYTYTFTNVDDVVNVYFGTANSIGTAEICGFKLEVGEVATGYTPSSWDAPGKKDIFYGDTTYIDGGNIYTGSIKAKHLDIDEIFSNLINAKNINITGGRINYEVDNAKDEIIKAHWQEKLVLKDSSGQLDGWTQIKDRSFILCPESLKFNTYEDLRNKNFESITASSTTTEYQEDYIKRIIYNIVNGKSTTTEDKSIYLDDLYRLIESYNTNGTVTYWNTTGSFQISTTSYKRITIFSTVRFGDGTSFLKKSSTEVGVITVDGEYILHIQCTLTSTGNANSIKRFAIYINNSISGDPLILCVTPLHTFELTMVRKLYVNDTVSVYMQDESGSCTIWHPEITITKIK